LGGAHEWYNPRTFNFEKSRLGYTPDSYDSHTAIQKITDTILPINNNSYEGHPISFLASAYAGAKAPKAIATGAGMAAHSAAKVLDNSETLKTLHKANKAVDFVGSPEWPAYSADLKKRIRDTLGLEHPNPTHLGDMGNPSDVTSRYLDETPDVMPTFRKLTENQ
jgi:hypothetical protein